MSDSEIIGQRKRVTDVEPNERMVDGLLVKRLQLREKWLVHALQTKDLICLASIEEAIARLAGKPEITFFKPAGDVTINREEMKKAINEILVLADNDRLLEDIVHTQSIMPKIGVENNMPVMDQLLKISPKSQHIYSLLGVQMQLAILIDQQETESNKETTEQE